MARITVAGDFSGDYVVTEGRGNGELVIKPDTSAAAILRRHGLKRSTVEAFEQKHGPVQPPDGEG